MGAHSLDLRKRIVDAVEKGDHTIRKVADLFGVHESFIYKLLRQKRELGDLAPRPHGGGAEAKITRKHLQTLALLLEQSPDATLEELREQLRKKACVEVGISTIWRALEALNISRKKKSGPASEADPVEREEFSRRQRRFAVERLVFLDEFSINTGMTCTHARCLRGQRAEVAKPFNWGKSISVISSLQSDRHWRNDEHRSSG